MEKNSKNNNRFSGIMATRLKNPTRKVLKISTCRSSYPKYALDGFYPGGLGTTKLCVSSGQSVPICKVNCQCQPHANTLKAAVHWERPGCALAQSSSNLKLAPMGLRADSARPQRVSGSARTDSRRAESARNPIAVHVKFGDDCACSAQPGLSQWTATLTAPQLQCHWCSLVTLVSRGILTLSSLWLWARHWERTSFAVRS